MTETAHIGLVGTGIMGRAMTRCWLEAGHDVTAWNRTRSKAKPLVDNGATLADTPTDVAREADYWITMVADGDAVRDVLERSEGLSDTLSGGPTWLQMSTVAAADTDDFAALADERDIDFVDAPVLGTKEPAESGDLTVLAAAGDGHRDQLEPIFEPIAAHTRWVGQPGDATRTKLVCNNWVVGLLGVLAETVALAEEIDVDPAHFFESIAGGPLDAGYAHIKGEMMQESDYPTSFSLRLALKDTNLILEAADKVDLDLSVARGVADLLERANDEGWKDDDMAAAIEGLRDAST